MTGRVVGSTDEMNWQQPSFYQTYIYSILLCTFSGIYIKKVHFMIGMTFVGSQTLSKNL